MLVFLAIEGTTMGLSTLIIILCGYLKKNYVNSEIITEGLEFISGLSITVGVAYAVISYIVITKCEKLT